ncbi:MAG: peptidoglycan editing factor PgeF [Ruminococcaceae bacterium]|nr:peptidoglycan editing factor PgeF [Oscillospiraceae bacterium]
MNSKSLKINTQGDLVYITFPRLEACGAVRHIFSTRLGGVSDGQYSTMNTSFSSGDEFTNVEENYRRLCGAVGIDVKNLVLSRQTHTNNVRIVAKSDCGTGYTRPSFQDVDGLITNESGVALVTQYADCTPLLFCDPVKHVCATSHAGWRGTVSGIGRVTVEKMINEFGCDPSNIIAAIGPCICQNCYEVDTPVLDAFAESGIDITGVFCEGRDENHFMLNLVEANKNILLSAGIKEENIDVSDICTCCNAGELHSHRATGGKRGNLAAIIELI